MYKNAELNIRQIVEKLTGFFLASYILGTTVFEGNSELSIIATITLYLFLILGGINILLKGKVALNYYVASRWLYGGILLVTFMFNVTDNASSVLYLYFTCAVLTLIVVNYINNKEKIYFLLKTYAFAGAMLCVVAFNFYGMAVFEQTANSIYGIRIGEEFGNVNMIGMVSGYSVILALYFLLFQRNKLVMKLVYIAIIVVCLSFTLLTGSKKALILIVMGLSTIFVLKGDMKKAIFSRIGYILLGIVGLLLLFWLIKQVDAFWYIGQRIEEMFQTLIGNEVSDTDHTRLYMIENSLEYFKNKPIFGNGVAYSYSLFGTYSHNNYAEILMNTGIVGFAVYYSSYIISIKRILCKNLNSDKLWSIILIITVSICVLEFGLVDYYERYFQILLAIVSVYLSFYKEQVPLKNALIGDASNQVFSED